jgi:hypothetical protein
MSVCKEVNLLIAVMKDRSDGKKRERICAASG